MCADTGLGEWYGTARFDHPSPASTEVLRGFFAWVEVGVSGIVPSRMGEGLEELHERVARAMEAIIKEEDRAARGTDGEGNRAILICTHAASMIAIGRALTGRMPKDVTENDFRTFTCGVSRFERRGLPHKGEVGKGNEGNVEWRGTGVGGGWDCVVNSDCSHLRDGEERGW